MGQLYATKEDMCQRFRLDDLNDLSENDDARLAAVLKTTSALIRSEEHTSELQSQR